MTKDVILSHLFSCHPEPGRREDPVQSCHGWLMTLLKVALLVLKSIFLYHFSSNEILKMIPYSINYYCVIKTDKEYIMSLTQISNLTKLFDSKGGKNNRDLDPKKINYSGIYATKDLTAAFYSNFQAEHRNAKNLNAFLNSDKGKSYKDQVFFVKTPKDPVELFTEVVSGQVISQLMQHTKADQQTVITADLVTIKKGLQGVIQSYDSVSQDLHKYLGTSKNEERYIPYELWDPKVYETFILEKSKEGYHGLSEALFYPQLVYNYSNHSGNVSVNTDTKKFISRDQGAGLRDFGYLQSLMEKFKAQASKSYNDFKQGQFKQLLSANGQLQNPYLHQWSVVDRKESWWDQMYKQVVRRYYQPINGLMMSVYAHAFSLNLNNHFKDDFISKQTKLIKEITGNSKELCAKITQHTGISGLSNAKKYAENLYQTIEHHARFMQLEFYCNLKQQNIIVDEGKFTDIVQSGEDKDEYIAALLDDYKKVLSIKQNLAQSTKNSIENKVKIYEILQDKTRLNVLLNDLKSQSNLYAINIYRSGTNEQLTGKSPVEVLSIVTDKISSETMRQATVESLCHKIMDLDRMKVKVSKVLDVDQNDLRDLLMVALAKRNNHYFSGKTTTTGRQIHALINSDQGYRNVFKGYLGVEVNKLGDVTRVPYRALRDYVAGALYSACSKDSEKSHKALEDLFCLKHEQIKKRLASLSHSYVDKVTRSNRAALCSIENYKKKAEPNIENN